MVRRAALGWVVLWVLLLASLPAGAQMPPQDLLVTGVTDSSVDLAWAPPPGATGGEFYNVYRNGKRMDMGPVSGTSLHIAALAPSTPSAYTVEVADPTGSPLSERSNRVGAVTVDGAVLQVPEQFATILDALTFAGPGTTIVVAAGTYREPGLWFGTERVTVKGAGAGATVIDLDGQFLDLSGPGAHAVVGVSIVNGSVRMAREDTLARSALLDGPSDSVVGGGFVTNCVFDRLWGVPASVGPGEHLTIANSIFLEPDPITTVDGPSSVLLLHNDFTRWPDTEWLQYPGEGNFSAFPDFECGYSLMPGSLCVDAGTDVGFQSFGIAPDVGPYEFGLPAPLSAPQNLQVDWAGPQAVSLSWDLTCGAGGVDVEVFRNGQSVGLAPGGFPPFTDWGLPPETPATYTVRTVDFSGSASGLSNRVGARTDLAGMSLRVPQDHTTIQEAIDVATPGTRIEVAPGTYAEPLVFSGKDGILLACQDANACTIDLRGTGFDSVDLDAWGGAVTVSGFTFRGATVRMGFGDTLVNSVIDETPNAGVEGSGLIANCVITGAVGGPGFRHELGQAAVIANSIIGPFPAIDYYDTPSPFVPEPLVLLHNNLVNDPITADFPPAGEGNFFGFPAFAQPGPPDTYYLESWDMGVNAGFEFGPTFDGFAPDVGAFEVGAPITARPPSGLAAAWDPQTLTVDLAWTPSPDDPSLSPDVQVLEYRVYRSEVSGEPVYAGLPVATLPAGATSFQDTAVTAGVTYHYQVVAFSGINWIGTELLSAPTAAASVAVTNEPPTAGDDAYSVDEDTLLVVSAPGVLANDTDPEGAPLTVELMTSTTLGSLALQPDGSFTYQPDPDFNGTDGFTYRVNDGAGQSAVATVTITVNPVNDTPVAVDDAAQTDMGAPVTVPVLANDTDADGDSLTVSAVDDAAHGSVTVNGDGTLTYTPEAGFYGTDSFVYTASDGAATAVATVTVTVVDTRPQLHVDVIKLTLRQRRKTYAKAVVVVRDAAGAKVSGVTVRGTWSGSVAGDVAAATNTKGKAKFVSAKLHEASGLVFTFTVTGLELDGYGYDPAANGETVDTVSTP